MSHSARLPAFACFLTAALCAIPYDAGADGAPSSTAATLAAHREVSVAEGDGDIQVADLRPAGGAWESTAWDDFSTHRLERGHYELRFRATARSAGTAVQIPPCAGRSSVRVDGREVQNAPGPLVVSIGIGDHVVTLALEVSAYERRIACGERPRVGQVAYTSDGFGVLVFASPHERQGGGKAVVYVPPGWDLHQLDKVLVGLHPWNGNIWTYASYRELVDEARAKGVLLLMPSGLGNSLYTADAEDEVMRAIDALSSALGVPSGSDSVHALHACIWGASMGGAGATTVAFHHPDRFLAVTSFFGDSSYDLSTYVRAILPDAHAAHLVNALDVVENARNLPVWLVHGESDTTSPIRQSEMLADAMTKRGFPVRFDRVPGIGHSGALVARFLREVVDLAQRPAPDRRVHATRVSYWSLRPLDLGAYGLHVERASPTGDAFVDIERRYEDVGTSLGSVHVLREFGLRVVDLDCTALGQAAKQRLPIVVDDRSSTALVRYACSAP